MLNDKGVRELAYVAEITDVKPIEGYDRVELAVVNGGWTCVVGKGQFKPGQLAVYFEIDSKLPEKPPFSDNEFIKKKKYKITTQKMCKSISQGLIMSFDEFDFDYSQYKKGDFLTELLEVTYAEPGDNKRKSAPKVNKYAKMAQRHPKAAKSAIWKWLWKLPNDKGKKILFILFGKVKDKNGWPNWVVKTDEERIQNMPWVLESDANRKHWIVTEKIDGTSTTFTLKKHGRKYDFYVCSRNVVFDEDEKGKCFYDVNYYTQMAIKYNMKEVLTKIIKDLDCEWVTIQGETYGNGVQKRDYSIDFQDFVAFNLIDSKNGRWNSSAAEGYVKQFGIYWVPIIDYDYTLPSTLEEMLEYADGESVLDGGMREGVVIRSSDAKTSFKAVSNSYLLRYHN